MFVTYTPEGTPEGEGQRWEFNPDRVRQSVAEMIEKRFGANWDNFRQGVQSGNAKARRVLLWHLLRVGGHHTLRYEDTPDFYMGEVVVEHSHAELLRLRDRLEKANLDDAEREQARTALDIELTDALTREGIAVRESDVDDEGKASAATVDSSAAASHA
jgi:hypothetical protein